MTTASQAGNKDIYIKVSQQQLVHGEWMDYNDPILYPTNINK